VQSILEVYGLTQAVVSSAFGSRTSSRSGSCESAFGDTLEGMGILSDEELLSLGKEESFNRT